MRCCCRQRGLVRTMFGDGRSDSRQATESLGDREYAVVENTAQRPARMDAMKVVCFDTEAQVA